MAKIFATTSGEISNRELEHMSKVRELAAQCMVLLKNDGALPLTGKPGKIALYGSGARKTVKGGTGSGDVNSRSVINVEQGLENAGFQITTKTWLADYDTQLLEEQKAYMTHVKKQAAEENILPFIVLFREPFVPPTGRTVTGSDVNASDTDTAIYVISRISGEGADRFDKEGDYRLTGEEVESIRFISEKYTKTIVILNVGGVMDTKELRNIPGINAILLMGQAGNIGGDALADVLTGKVTPGGKLTTTWAENYSDYPSSKEFSHNNGDIDDSWYTEGIYVGYRYFDTFDVQPAYPFGYGKSYTDFQIDVLDVTTDSVEVTVEVKVTNTGSVYAGREVVQIYYSAPSGKLEKPYQELAAYGKTGLLAPGESEILKIMFSVKNMSSYNEKTASWILEAGSYYIRVGNSSRSTGVAAKLVLEQEITTQKLKNLFRAEAIDELSSKAATPYTYPEEQSEKDKAKAIKLDASKIKTFTPAYTEYHPVIPQKPSTDKIKLTDILEGKATLEELVGQLTVEEMAELCIGSARGAFGTGSAIGAASFAVPGAAGDTTSAMIDDRDIRNMILADGPAGLRLQPVFHVRDEEICPEPPFALPGIEELMGDFFKKPDLTGATPYYQYCTAIPIASLLAMSWDYDLIREAGNIVGKEMEEFGVTLWLAPGMNIHRNPLCGRNFEYYSEDPLISGMCAAADTEGIQSHPGVGTTIKHFAVNNQEDNRNFNNSHVSERALREIYLKGFEIAVRKAQPMSIMSSYNLLNGVHTANSYDLLTQAARDEWGFAGIIMTDWGTTGHMGIEDNSIKKYPASSPAMCIKAGNDLIMPGSGEDLDDVIAAVNAKEGEVPYPITLGDLQFCTKNMLKLIMQTSCYSDSKPYSEQFELEKYVSVR